MMWYETYGMVWYGYGVWYDVQCGIVWYDMVWCVWYDIIWCVWYDMIWCGMVWSYMVWVWCKV